MSTDTPWRDPSRLTEEDQARLSRMTDRQAQALGVTSDEHEFVWGFRQDRPAERHRMLAGEAAFTRDRIHEQLGRRGHAMTWQLHSDDPQYATTWDGECADCGANTSADAGGSSMWRGGKDARTADCSGPGTAWQDEMLRDLQHERIAGAVREFGQEVKDARDRQWLSAQGIERELEAGG